MELRHLRYFIAVALEENVTRAAEKLNVSQPALSRQVRDLEEELGFPLLERSAKSVALTEAGRVFLDEASAVLERLEQGIQVARLAARDDRGDIHIGYAPSLTVRILPPTIRAFQAAYPKVKVKLHDLSSEEMAAGLRSGKLDIAFLLEDWARRGGLKFEALKEEAVRLAVGVDHPLAGQGRVSLSMVAGEPLLGYSLSEYPEYGDMLKRVFRESGEPRKLDEQHESVSSLVTAIESGMGVAIVSESLSCVASGRVALLDLEPKPRPMVVGAAWHKESLSARETAFLEKARESCASGVA